MRFDSLDTLHPEKWDHTHWYGALGLGYTNRFVRNFELGAANGAVAVKGYYAYVAGSMGLHIYDIADPTSGLALVDISNPSTISDANLMHALDWTNSTPENVVLNGTHAFVSDSSEGLKIIELFP